MRQVTQDKLEARALWAAGDFDAIAELVWEVGARVVRAAQVSVGDDVLDVACGTGNASIPAAESGARVVGVDLTPELFIAGRGRAAQAGVDVEWVEGDAEALPFPDESFDVVLSTFGCMFAPEQFVTAREMARMLRPDGRIGIVAWKPDGAMGEFFKLMGSYTQPPPPPVAPPTAWGTAAHVRRLFDGTGIALEFEEDKVMYHFDSGEDYVEFFEDKFGPVLMARRALESDGRWDALRNDMIALFDQHNGDAGFPGEYLLVTGTKAREGA